MEADEINHPNFDQGGLYGRVVNLPETLLYFGFTRSAYGGILSGRIKSEQSLVRTAMGCHLIKIYMISSLLGA